MQFFYINLIFENIGIVFYFTLHNLLYYANLYLCEYKMYDINFIFDNVL